MPEAAAALPGPELPVPGWEPPKGESLACLRSELSLPATTAEGDPVKLPQARRGGEQGWQRRAGTPAEERVPGRAAGAPLRARLRAEGRRLLPPDPPILPWCRQAVPACLLPRSSHPTHPRGGPPNGCGLSCFIARPCTDALHRTRAKGAGNGHRPLPPGTGGPGVSRTGWPPKKGTGVCVSGTSKRGV